MANAPWSRPAVLAAFLLAAAGAIPEPPVVEEPLAGAPFQVLETITLAIGEVTLTSTYTLHGTVLPVPGGFEIWLRAFGVGSGKPTNLDKPILAFLPLADLGAPVEPEEAPTEEPAEPTSEPEEPAPNPPDGLEAPAAGAEEPAEPTSEPEEPAAPQDPETEPGAPAAEPADPAADAPADPAPEPIAMLPSVPVAPPEGGEIVAGPEGEERPRPRPSPTFGDLDEETLAAWLEPLALMLTVAAAVPVEEMRAARVVQPEMEHAGWEAVWSEGGDGPRVTLAGSAAATHAWPPTGLPRAPLLFLPFTGPGSFDGESGEGPFGLPFRLSWRQEGRLGLKWTDPIEASRTWQLAILPPE